MLTLISGSRKLDTPMRVTAKTRPHRQRAQAAEGGCGGRPAGGSFDEAVARPAAGQSLVVIYDGDAVVGGGDEVSE